jgi:hypothetical protein
MALRSYLDPETGVSVRYPAAWKKSVGSGYGGDPLTEYTVDNPNPPKARLRVGWMFPVKEPDLSSPIAEDVSFAYAVLPAATATACSKAFDGWGSEGTEDVVVNGVKFHHVSYSDAGLGHSWSFELYSTFHNGHCLGFSDGDQISHPDDEMHFPRADRAVSTDADAVFHSLRLLPVKQP